MSDKRKSEKDHDTQTEELQLENADRETQTDHEESESDLRRIILDEIREKVEARMQRDQETIEQLKLEKKTLDKQVQALLQEERSILLHASKANPDHELQRLQTEAMSLNRKMTEQSAMLAERDEYIQRQEERLRRGNEAREQAEKRLCSFKEVIDLRNTQEQRHLKEIQMLQNQFGEKIKELEEAAAMLREVNKENKKLKREADQWRLSNETLHKKLVEKEEKAAVLQKKQSEIKNLQGQCSILSMEKKKALEEMERLKHILHSIRKTTKHQQQQTEYVMKPEKMSQTEDIAGNDSNQEMVLELERTRKEFEDYRKLMTEKEREGYAKANERIRAARARVEAAEREVARLKILAKETTHQKPLADKANVV